MIELKNKTVVVFGLGVSGISAVKVLFELGAKLYAVNNGEVSNWAKSPGVLDFISIDHCLSENDTKAYQLMESAELVILSPGIPRNHLLLNSIHQRNVPIWGEIELGYKIIKNFNGLVPIIGITGTNGKTTTTTFLGEMIKDQGRKVFVGGNIGIPFCDMAFEVIKGSSKYDYILLELSSFQLESIIDFKPDIAMILNVFQNHGERYSEISDYAFAKFNITKNMTSDDFLIVPSDFEIIKKWSDSQKLKVISFDTRKPKVEIDLSSFHLPGHHNVVNLKFILIVADILKFDHSKMMNTINQFRGVHHRVEYVPSKYSFKAYNDAKSTNWDATVTAVLAMNDFKEDLYLIIGGKKRGHGDSIMPSFVTLNKRVKKYFLIGEMASEIFNEIKDSAVCEKYLNLDEVINAIKNEKFNGIVLFSPGFPSFDQYANYEKRGEHFISLVN